MLTSLRILFYLLHDYLLTAAAFIIAALAGIAIPNLSPNVQDFKYEFNKNRFGKGKRHSSNNTAILHRPPPAAFETIPIPRNPRPLRACGENT
jgi:hypothetical protein